MRQLYEIIDGNPRLLIDWGEYRRVMYNLSINEDIIFNPFIHLIKGTYSFDGNIVTISPEMGVCTIDIKKNDIEIIYRRAENFYELYSIQIEYWNLFNIPMVEHLVDCLILDKQHLYDYCSVLFFPPIKDIRTEWDIIEVRPNYYIHNTGENEWCLYKWISGQKEECLNIFETGNDINIIKNTFRKIVDDMGDETSAIEKMWSKVIYNEDGTFTLTKCG